MDAAAAAAVVHAARPTRYDLADEEDDDEDASSSGFSGEDEDEDEDEDSNSKESEHSSPSEGDEEEEADDDDDDLEGSNSEPRLHAVGSTKFAQAMKHLLGGPGEGDDDDDEGGEDKAGAKQKLFQRKTKIMKLAESERLAQRQAKKKQQERARFDMLGVRTLPDLDPAAINTERELKRIATKGVVALFNAIGTHQRQVAKGQGGSTSLGKKTGVPNKESFLKMLSEQVLDKEDESNEDDDEDENPPPPKMNKTGSVSGWKVLQEDYLERANQGEESFSEEEEEEEEEEIE